MRRALLLALLIAGNAHADSVSVSVMTGSLGTDRLGGVGSSKSVASLLIATDRRGISGSVWVWHIAERLDDDAGISPRYGFSADVETAAGPWRAGLATIRTDDRSFNYLSAGIGTARARVSLLVPVERDDRYGLRVRLSVPISGKWSASLRYEYAGRQDPDLKVVHVGFGLGREWRP